MRFQYFPRFVGIAVLATAPVWINVLACNCDPPGPPPIDRCVADTTPTVTAIRVFGGLPSMRLEDGDPLPLVFGGQGGRHMELAIELDGTGFGTCAVVAIDIAGSGSFNGGVRVQPTDTGVLTGRIVLFPTDTSGCHEAVATAYGVTERVRLGTCTTSDGGTDVGSVCGDGRVGPGEECDDPDRAVCRADCTRERCDGVAVAAETCFQPGPMTVTDEVRAMSSRELGPGEQLVTAVRRLDGRYALELRDTMLELVAAVELDFEPGNVVWADRDGDGISDDVVVLSDDGSRLVEGGTVAGRFELGTTVVLPAAANGAFAITACGVDDAAGDEVMLGVGEAIVRLGATGTWTRTEGQPRGLGCAAGSPRESVIAGTEFGVSVYEQAPDRTVTQTLAPLPEPSFRIETLRVGLVAAFGLPPAFFGPGGFPFPYPLDDPFSDIGGVMRDGRVMLALIGVGGRVQTVHAGLADVNDTGINGLQVEGLGDAFVVYDGGLLVLLTPGA